ncbi:MAG: helix-turn-helix domain-containing protein [Ruminococcaceae bacterium]|nr:helix-turn-helix domain-containing protein [Oscillospiraceae bacterium]
MNYITVKEAADKWGVSTRRVQFLCSQNRIKGANRLGKSWLIPESAVLPNAKRKDETPTLPMPRKSPFLDMTNLYNKAGCADECAEMLINQPEAHALFEAQIAFRRGEIDKVYERARYFLQAHSGFYAILGGGMLLAQCAIWRGDLFLWKEAKKHICEAPCKDEHDRELVSLAIAIIDSSIYDNKDYPEWFKMGNFEALPGDAHPAAKVFYVKYLYMAAYAIATKQFKLEGVEGLALMRMLPNSIEPMISQAVIDKTVIPEMYLRMSCAVAYYYSGMKDKAIVHIDKAVKLAISDGMYGFLAEYVRHFDELLEQRIALQDENAAIAVKGLYNIYSVGWARLSAQVREKVDVAGRLDAAERQIVKLCAFGYTNREIAAMLYTSESTVSHAITRILNKTGLMNKKEFAFIV